MNPRAALAILLFVATAIIVAPKPLPPPPPEPEQPIAFGRRPTPQDLPNACAITATEAVARLSATGSWTRLILIFFRDPRAGQNFVHLLAVWQPPTAHTVLIYDRNGTWDLATTEHLPIPIAREWAKHAHVVLIKARFIP